MDDIQSQVVFHKNSRTIVATSETQLTEGETNRLEHSDQDGVIVIAFSLETECAPKRREYDEDVD